MRITHVITRLIVGGAQENTVASVLGLRAIPGLEVHLVSGPTTGPEGSLEGMVSPVPGLLDIEPDLIRAPHPWRDFLAWRSLVSRFKREKPDIVHTHSGKAGVLGRLAARRAGVPVIVHTIHGPSFGKFQGQVPNVIYTAAERVAGRVTTHFVSVAHAMTEQYLAAGIGRREQYSRILSGFPLEPFLGAANDPALRRELGIGTGDFVVGKIARLFELKGHDDLFQVAPALVKKCPNMRFLLVGDGNWRERFSSMAREQGIEKHVIFTGLIPPREIPRFVGIMDALVHLSRREGLPRALPQAMAAGKPVVAFDCDGAREVCVDGTTGLLVQPGDLTALSGALSRLAGDAGLRSRLGEEGRAMVSKLFPVERMVEQLHALYLRLVVAWRGGTPR
jgi:glycosyltransferase involved in cell wall biosynthesis